jgi:hypothetical protein
MQPRFAFKCAYQGEVWFTVTDQTGSYSLQLRTHVPEYLRSTFNGDDSAFQRQVVDIVGVLTREYRIDQPVPMDTAQAFNAWRLAEYDAACLQIEADPIRYGQFDRATDSRLRSPVLAHSTAHYVSGDGWTLQPILDVRQSTAA